VVAVVDEEILERSAGSGGPRTMSNGEDADIGPPLPPPPPVLLSPLLPLSSDLSALKDSLTRECRWDSWTFFR